jgi:hypothetical protein
VLLCSKLFDSWYYSSSLNRQKEEDDEVEELHLPTKKQKIEIEHFAPPPFPSSSSSSTKSSRNYTSIQKDVGKEGKFRWRYLCKIPGITELQKQNWGEVGVLSIIFLLPFFIIVLFMILMSLKNLKLKSKR